MKRESFLSACLLLLLSGVFNAQDDPYVDVCAVSLVDLTSKETQTADSWDLRRLGTFEPVGGEEQRTTGSFKIPGTKLFAVATVFFTDESMAVETPSKSNDVSASLELLVSRTPHVVWLQVSVMLKPK